MQPFSKAKSDFCKNYAKKKSNFFTEKAYIYKALSYTIDFYYSVKWKITWVKVGE